MSFDSWLHRLRRSQLYNFSIITTALLNYYYYSHARVPATFIHPKVMLHFKIMGQSLHIIIQSAWITSSCELSSVNGFFRDCLLFWTRRATHMRACIGFADYKPLIRAVSDDPFLLYYNNIYRIILLLLVILVNLLLNIYMFIIIIIMSSFMNDYYIMKIMQIIFEESS
jgi:hypothetical protein